MTWNILWLSSFPLSLLFCWATDTAAHGTCVCFQSSAWPVYASCFLLCGDLLSGQITKSLPVTASSVSLVLRKTMQSFLRKSHSNSKTSQKTPRTSALQPICYLSTAQLPKKPKNLTTKNVPAAQWTHGPWPPPSLASIEIGESVAGEPRHPSKTSGVFFFKAPCEKMTQHFQEPLFFLLGCFLVVSIWLEHVEISLKHPFICGALKWQRRNLPELFFKHQLNSTRIQVVTIPSITR